MPNRTLKFYGQGYGASAPQITVSLNGNTVFMGPVDNSIDAEPPGVFVPADYDLLYQAELPMNYNNTTAAFSLSVTGGTGIYTGLVEINYNAMANAESSGSAGFFAIQPDANSNVSIDGQIVPVPDPRPEGQQGAWTYFVPAGSTMTATLNIPMGKD